MAKLIGSSLDAFGPVLTTSPSAASPISTYSGGQPAPPVNGIPSD